MGWLRQLMLESSRSVDSYGTLARLALAHPQWPEDVKVQQRSLAAVFSKLDREVDLEWLTDRPAVQRVLVELLGCSPGELRGIREPTGADEARVRLVDLPYARGLDLRTEPPPPGPPADVLSPPRWQRMWWNAPSGSGRSLVGRWLRARGQSDFVDLLPPSKPVGLMPEGPVFLELHSRRSASHLCSILPRRCCVAAPFWPEHAGIDPDGFCKIDSVSPTRFLPALVDWVARRLPSDTRFESQAALSWLLEEALPLKLVDSPGAALGLCGLLDEVGADNLRGKGLSELVHTLVLGRLARAASKAPEQIWFRDAHLAVLDTLAEHWHLDAQVTWDEPRTRDEWLLLVPDELGRGGDLEWLRVGLPGANPVIRPRDIERAAERLPPGAFRLLTVLSDLGLLRPVRAGSGLEIPAPRWLWLALSERVLRGLVDSSPPKWGEALLTPRLAERVTSTLAQRVAVDAVSAIEDVLETDAGDEPGYAAAVEATFVHSGLELLSGHEIPADPLCELFAEQMLLVVDFDEDLPRPRFGLPGEPGDLQERHGMWLACALAISEQLEVAAGNHPLLCPWSKAHPDPRHRAMLDVIHVAALAAHQRNEPWALGVYRLVDRVRQAIGDSGGSTRPTHPLERPGHVVDEIIHGIALWASIETLGADPAGLDGLASVARERGIPWPKVVEAAWTAWRQADCPPSDLLASAASTLLWSELPLELLRELLATRRRRDVPYHWLGERHWALLVALATQDPPEGLTASVPWHMAPGRHLWDLLASGAPLHPETIAHAWRQDPTRTAIELARSLREGVPAVVELLAACPAEQATTAASHLSAQLVLGLATPVRDSVRAWLCRQLHIRPAGWLVAFQLLGQVEEALRALPSTRTPSS